MILSKGMQQIILEEGQRRGLNRLDQELNEFSHVIIKNVWEDERLYLVSVAKRLQYCMPVLPM
jgi:hypothetical protein